VVEGFLFDGVDVGGTGVAIDERVKLALPILTHAAFAPLPFGQHASMGTEPAANVASLVRDVAIQGPRWLGQIVA
jgi:hypothetical protein